MKNPNSFKQGKYTLLYSQESLKYWSATRAITNDGIEVNYTCMIDEKESGNWQNSYKFEDTQVVGYIDDTKQITFCSPLTHDHSFPQSYRKIPKF